MCRQVELQVPMRPRRREVGQTLLLLLLLLFLLLPALMLLPDDGSNRHPRDEACRLGRQLLPPACALLLQGMQS